MRTRKLNLGGCNNMVRLRLAQLSPHALQYHPPSVSAENDVQNKKKSRATIDPYNISRATVDSGNF